MINKKMISMYFARPSNTSYMFQNIIIRVDNWEQIYKIFDFEEKFSKNF